MVFEARRRNQLRNARITVVVRDQLLKNSITYRNYFFVVLCHVNRWC